MRVTFFWGGEDDLSELQRVDPTRDWQRFCFGERIWTLQTHLRLLEAGFVTELSRTAPDDGLLIYHANHLGQLKRQRHRLKNVFTLAIRGDKTRPLMGDAQVLQNQGSRALGRRSFFVPHWPQPGLMERHPGRGDKIRRIVYKGYYRNLDPVFRTSDWKQFLNGLGIEWVEDAVPFDGPRTDIQGLDWADYRNVDMVVAVRPGGLRRHRSKPASKLYNAWLAGVPAVVGRERAYRELRRSDLDFVEVGSLDEAKAAVRRLVEYPEIYNSMIENGRRRAIEFSTEQILEGWSSLIYGRIAELVENAERSRFPWSASRWLPLLV